MQDERKARQKFSVPKPVAAKLSAVKGLFKKKWLRIAAGAAAGVLLAAVLGWWAWSNSSLSRLSAEAAIAEGTVEYRLDDELPWEKVQTGMTFGERAQLRALGNSRAAFVIEDGSVVRVGSNSSIMLAELKPGRIVIQNTGGQVYTRVIQSDKRAFQTESQSAAYQSKAAAYRSFNTGQNEGLEVYYGQVNVMLAEKQITIGQGNSYFVKNTGQNEGKIAGLSQQRLSSDAFLRWNSDQDRNNFAGEMGVLFDIIPPALEISSPNNGLVTDSASIEIKGTAEAGAKLSMNNEPVPNDNGRFTAVFNLSEGENLITLRATDSAGNNTVKRLTIIRNSALSEPAPPYVPPPTGTPVLKKGEGANVTWTLDGSAPYGFRLVWSENPEPKYPDDKYETYDAAATSGSITEQQGTYYVRVCAYHEGSCINYSNEITIKLP